MSYNYKLIQWKPWSPLFDIWIHWYAKWRYFCVYDPDSDEDDYELLDVTDDAELDEVAKLLEEYME